MDIKTLCNPILRNQRDSDLTKESIRLFKSLCDNIQQTNTPPDILYKYLTIDGATQLLEGLSLKFTPPHEFDDIFELTDPGNVNYNTVEKTKIKKLLRIIDRLTDDFDILNKLKTRIGIACYSTNWDINIMWSLYAEKHTGVVIGFKTKFLAPLCEVTYCPLEEYDAEFANIVDSAKYMVFTKTYDWVWQREWRSIDLLENLKIIEYPSCKLFLKTIPPEAIAEIYIGANSNEVYRPIDEKHLAFEKSVRKMNLQVPIYACMKDIQKRGNLSRTLIE